MTDRRVILLVSGAASIGLWEFAARSSFFLSLLISSPSRLFQYSLAHGDTLLLDLSHTLIVAAGGLAIALVVGFSTALAGLRYRGAASFLEGASTIAQSIPLVVFAPFMILIFGVGYVSQIGLASLMAIFPCVIGVLAAMRSARAEFDELLLLYDVPFRHRVVEVYLPHALPALVGTIRISAALAVLGAVIAEFTGSATGLGRNIFLGTVRLDPELIMSALLLTSLVGVAIHLLLTKLEKRASWWR